MRCNKWGHSIPVFRNIAPNLKTQVRGNVTYARVKPADKKPRARSLLSAMETGLYCNACKQTGIPTFLNRISVRMIYFHNSNAK